MSDNWVVQNLENALETWNEKLSEIWTLITTTPQNFKGGNIWKVIVDINGAVQAIGLALLVLSDEVVMKLNDQLNMIRDNIGTEQEISITYFVPDDKKSGGAYLTHSGIVKKIDEFERKLIMQDETVIPTEQISVIQGEMFKGLYE